MRNILCIEILSNDVYIEYTNGDIQYTSFTQAKKILSKGSYDSIKFSCIDSKRSVDFLNSLLHKYTIINAFNSLQFLSKKETLHLIDRIKKGVKRKGYIIIAGFSVDDPLYKKTIVKNRCFFDLQELKKIFSNFNIIFYKEAIIKDKGHPGNPKPHTHGVVKIIAQK